MSGQGVPCGACGAIGAYDPACPECRPPDPTFDQEHMLLPCEIRSFRQRMGLSQSRLAARLPAARRTIEDWEAGRRNPPHYLERALRDLERELGSGNGTRWRG